MALEKALLESKQQTVDLMEKFMYQLEDQQHTFSKMLSVAQQRVLAAKESMAEAKERQRKRVREQHAQDIQRLMLAEGLSHQELMELLQDKDVAQQPNHSDATSSQHCAPNTKKPRSREAEMDLN